MKKLFFGLLIIAVGAGIFFYLQSKKQTSSQNTIQKDLIVGKWKMESVKTVSDSTKNLLIGIATMIDTNMLNYDYEFTKTGNVYCYFGDSLIKGSSRYQWQKENKLIWKDDSMDSVGTLLQILKLNKDSLQLLDKDSVVVCFTKQK